MRADILTSKCTWTVRDQREGVLVNTVVNAVNKLEQSFHNKSLQNYVDTC